MVDRDAVCVLVPTYNEAETIGDVVGGFREEGFEHVLVMDGGSTDGTRELATDAGASVEIQSGSGKGQAVREAVEMIAQSVVLLVDGDSTYRSSEAEAMLEPIFDGAAEHVIGNRFANMQPGAMTRMNKVGNGLINRTFRFIHGRDLEDILSGYRAFTRESFQRLTLTADGFGIETEMAVECVKHDVPTAVVPITYEPRPKGSETNLRPVRDGGNIIVRLYQMAKTNNPIFYFGSLGVINMLLGVLLAAFVAFRYITAGISHEVIALAGGVALLFGIQLIMFGVLSDLIVTANRKQTRKLERIATQLEAQSTAVPIEEGERSWQQSAEGDGGDSEDASDAGGGEPEALDTASDG